ncbi:SNARE protein [Spironucleus salmonicida]|uniref:SNARE protein n=1 Tax=Spironucleus salmonicida TaxID=348837 RepID=V6LBE9_9EUKA|nr:SNARE protein [Spironucleus salmonicida]|eukprot:EST41780.1 hypothetical protein SS50377_18613 [Spironucleus salmonicida]
MDQYKNSFEQLRRKINDTITKLQRIQQNQSNQSDQTSIHTDVNNANQQFKTIQIEFKKIMSQSPADAKQLDEQMRYLSSRSTQLNDSYKTYQNSSLKELEVNPEQTFGGYEQAQALKQQNEQNVEHLIGKAKLLGAQNKLINEKLVEGDEVMNELHGDVDMARDKVGAATSRVNQFSTYLKKNKAPFWVCIIVLIISVFFWSTKAFCTIGFTWQC